jgi:hypothetical protein
MMLDYDKINDDVNAALEGEILTPQSAMQKVRAVLEKHDVDLPIVFDMDEDGDEYAFKVEDHYLYFIYAKLNNGFYESFAEIADEARLMELLEEDGEE